MAASSNFPLEQRGVALRMAAAVCITVLVSTSCLYRGAATSTTLAERLIVAARADVFVIFWLAATIGNVARLRFFSPDDIAGSGSEAASAKLGRARAVLQNTLEQVVLAVLVHVALAVLVASSAPLIVALSTVFAIGRLHFWTGYSGGAQARAFGFGLTFYPSLAGLISAMFFAMRLAL